jgi:hypothetical protein
MTKATKILLFLFLTVLFSVNTHAQKDTTNTSSNLKVLDSDLSLTKSTNSLKSSSATKRVLPSSNFNVGIDKKVNPNAIDKQLNNYKAPPQPQNILLQNKPEDKDIIGRRYWKGKDVTNKRLASNMSLGTINSVTKTVRIECRDHSYIDGDRIKIYLNEKSVSDNIGLKGSYYVVYVTLEEGYNRIDFQALNQGFSGPNTAELNVYDENGNLISAKDWNLETGQTATLGIIRKQ